MLFIYSIILLVQCIFVINAKWVVDVDSSIIEEIQQNPTTGYLIKFHAPWCGHCRHFEPVYEEIAKEVHELSATDDEFKNIQIVRIDATVYSNVANYYDIRGFPTVKFIRGSQIIPYESERSKKSVLNFLKRVNGPSIRWISSIDQFDELRHEHDVFFLYVTKTKDEDDRLLKEYNDVVNRYLSQAYFYATNVSIIPETLFSEHQSNDESQLFAIKNDEFYLYKPEEYNNTLDEFILKEKVATFPQVASGNIYELILTRKIILIYGYHEHQSASQRQIRNKLKSQVHNYILNHKSLLHHTFQFAWSHDLDLLNNIAVWTLEEPLLFLYDSVNRQYGIYQLSSVIDNNLEIEPILDYVTTNHSQIILHTGNTWTKRIFRPFWELSRTIMAMFIEAPLITMLVIGLPASVLSIVCYCLFCLPNETFIHDQEMRYATRRHDQSIEQNEEEQEDNESEGDNDASASPQTPNATNKTLAEKKEE